jgi:threonine aldolase
MKGFGSDNHSGVHPTILNKLIESNIEHQPSYGTDIYSQKAIDQFKEYFGDLCHVHFVYNGTAANVLCLQAALRKYESFLCSDVSHLYIDECGAPEFFSGKLIPVKSENGKIIISEIEKHLIRKGDQHYSQPKLISITQPTELGTCYTINEIKEIVTLAKKHQMYVHIDGARLTNACSFLQTSYKNITTDLGIDLLSFGGTKNGLAFGEAVIILNKNLQKDFKYIRKQSAQLPSKTRFIASQFLGYFENNLNFSIAEHVLKMAQMLTNEIKKYPELTLTQITQSNAVFVKIPKHLISVLRDTYFFYVWDELTFECRLMTSWDTTEAEILNFSQIIQKNIKST